MKELIILIFILFMNISGFTQKADEQIGVWYMYGGNHKLSEKFNAKTMAHFRFFDIANDFQQLVTRLGINYNINSHINVTVGYGYFYTDTTFNIDNGEITESRIYEDINLKHKIALVKFGHRFRFEQRFLENNNTTKHLFRYNLGVSHPITTKLSGYIYDEIHFNLKGKNFAQNWTGLGVKYKVSKLIKLQLGYMKILNNTTNFDRLQVGIAISH